MERAELLKDFIESWKDQPVIWGESDCTAFAAKWVELATGLSVPFLADYASMDEAHAIIAHHGGLLPIWDEALKRVGIYPRRDNRKFDKPELGDVALVRTADHGDVGVIVANDGTCILRTETGTRFLRPRNYLRVWSLYGL